MTDMLALDLVSKGLVTDQIVLRIGYDRKSLTDPKIKKMYKGQTTTDAYGRVRPKSARGTTNLNRHTSSAKLIIDAVMELYNNIVDDNLLIRRVTISANHILKESEINKDDKAKQLNIFKDYDQSKVEKKEEKIALSKERKIQEAILNIKEKYGKNAVIKGANLEEGATALDRNNQIGGHKK
jgi:DNA polymerase V